MSDIIIEEKETIDKYEEDAIIAFVGAPLKMEDHAEHACCTAVRMKKALEELDGLGNIYPDFFCRDNVASYYKKLLEKYFVNGTYPTDQDEEGVAFNSETGGFSLLQK